MKRIITVCVASAALVAASISVVVAQNEQAPGAQAPAAQEQGGGGRGGRGGGRGGGGGATVKPSALRAIPAETTAAKAKDPNWQAPRTPWGHPDIQGTFSTDDMRGIPQDRNANQGERQSLTPEEFAQRAGNDEAGRNRAVNQESFLRNEFGIRTFGFTSLMIEPANGRRPALTAKAQARQKALAGVGTFGSRPLNGFEDFSLYDRCITRGVSSIGPAIYGNGVRIVQSPTEVVVTYEMIHDSRVIYLDGRPRVNSKITPWLGDSRGRWDGDTLVVETTNFYERGPNVFGVPPSATTKLTEWFTRIDPQMVEYKARVEDPEMVAAPFTLRWVITTQPDYPDVYEYSCHEGNSAVEHGLRSERIYDQEEADLRAKGLPVPPRPTRMDVYGAPDRNLKVRDVNAEPLKK
jgi:Spy/CpxP family protein refolding chaperone